MRGRKKVGDDALAHSRVFAVADDADDLGVELDVVATTLGHHAAEAAGCRSAEVFGEGFIHDRHFGMVDGIAFGKSTAGQQGDLQRRKICGIDVGNFDIVIVVRRRSIARHGDVAAVVVAGKFGIVGSRDRLHSGKRGERIEHTLMQRGYRGGRVSSKLRIDAEGDQV